MSSIGSHGLSYRSKEERGKKQRREGLITLIITELFVQFFPRINYLITNTIMEDNFLRVLRVYNQYRAWRVN